MNFYLKELPFAPASGLFATKQSAFSSKTQCILVQNGVCFDAKRKVFWC